jgi:hypothetical protein
LWGSSNASRKLKAVIYKAIIRPVVLHGAETWTLTRRDEERLLTWERKLLRKFYGAVNEKGQWRIRRNMELYQLYKDLDLVTEIRKRRVHWTGHAERIEVSRIPIKLIHLIHSNPEGRRRTERPKKRWVGDVEEDLRKIGVRGWRRKAKEKNEWSLRRPRSYKDCSARRVNG